MKNKQYEIRHIDGQDVFFKKINDAFYLINDIVICLGKGVSPLQTDDDIRDCFVYVENPFFEYHGSNQGFCLLLGGDDVGNCVSEFTFENYSDQSVVKKVKEALCEYRKWVGL